MAAGFEVIKDLRDAELVELPVSSFTGTKGDLVERLAAGTGWTACTATSPHFTPKAILMETITSASSVLAYLLTGFETVRAESANNANASHNGDLMVLTDTNTVNNTGTTSSTEYAAFVQEGYSGATTDKRLIGRVLVGNGVDPDATT
jgi:hypothetical protein